MDGYSTVEKNDHYGLIDKTGKEVYPCTSDEGIWAISPGNYIVNNNGVKSVVNIQGQATLPFKNFGELYYDKENNQYALNDEKGKWVIATPDGTVKIKVDGEGLIYRSDGVYLLSKTTDSTGTQNAVMNGKGELVVPYGKYYSISPIVSNGLICVGIKSGETPSSEEGITNINQKVGYIDVTGKEIIPLQFQDAMLDFSEGLAGVSLKDKMGFIDTTGKMVIPATFDKVNSFQNGYAKVWNADTTHFIDKTGRIIN